jgi:hypothetical protein
MFLKKTVWPTAGPMSYKKRSQKPANQDEGLETSPESFATWHMRHLYDTVYDMGSIAKEDHGKVSHFLRGTRDTSSKLALANCHLITVFVNGPECWYFYHRQEMPVEEVP